MSCNGCRVLRKGCSENCILRPSIQWIQTPEAQGYATVFVAKFFGRAGLMSFISDVPESQAPALFQSLLYEACGRTINPVNGAIGLLWTGNWSICQAAVQTILRGGSLKPIPEIGGFAGFPSILRGGSSEICNEMLYLRRNDSDDRKIYHHCRFSNSRSRSRSSPPKRKRLAEQQHLSELNLSQIPNFRIKTMSLDKDTCRPETPSIYSDESVTVSPVKISGDCYDGEDAKLLNLFV